MQTISKFTLYSEQATLEVKLNQGSSQTNDLLSLPYEYLRIFSPSELKKVHSNKKPSTPLTPQVFHKKNVQISAIEPVGKHGHRFIFDDGFSDIYSTLELVELSTNYNDYWTQYLNGLTATQSREESINFKAVT